MPPWKIDRVRQQMRGWTPDAVALALRAVAAADAGVKGGGDDPEYALEKAVVTIARRPPAPRRPPDPARAAPDSRPPNGPPDMPKAPVSVLGKDGGRGLRYETLWTPHPRGERSRVRVRGCRSGAVERAR